jgi:hypothetical protein
VQPNNRNNLKVRFMRFGDCRRTNWIPASLSTSDLAMYPLASIAVIVMILLFFII